MQYKLYSNGRSEEGLTASSISLQLFLGLCVASTLLACGGESRQDRSSVESNSAPSWPVEASLRVSELSARSLRLSWPRAEDDQEVVAYEIIQDGSLLTRLEANVEQLILSTLEPMTPYRFEIVALDEAELKSESLELEVVTMAESLSVSNEQRTLIESWMAASDFRVDAISYVDEESEEELSATAILSWRSVTSEDEPNSFKLKVNGVNAEPYPFRNAEIRERFNVIIDHLRIDEWTLFELEYYALENQFLSANLSLRTFIPSRSENEWPVGASLTVDQDERGTSLSWPSLRGEFYPILYQVSLDEVIVATLKSTALEEGERLGLRLAPLDEGQQITAKVSAMTTLGEMIGEALTVEVTGRDRSAPQWPVNALLSYELFEIEESDSYANRFDVKLIWPAAQDLFNEIRYELWSGGELLVTLDPSELTSTGEEGDVSKWSWRSAQSVTDLEITWGAQLQIFAIDGLNHRSEPLTTRVLPELSADDVELSTWPPLAQVQVVKLDPESAEIAWPPLLSRGEAYTPEYYQLIIEGQSPIRVEGTVRTMSISGLRAEQQYTLSLIAILNGASIGPTLITTIFTPPYPAPSWPPEEVPLITHIRHDQFDVTWSSANLRSRPTSYRLWLNDRLIHEHLVDQTMGAEPPSYRVTIDGLNEQSDYSLRIDCVGASGLSALSPLTAELSTLARPTLVWAEGHSLSVVEQSDTTLELRWTEWSLETNEESLAHYELYRDEQLVDIIPPEETTIAISGLRPRQRSTWSVQVRGTEGGFSYNGPSLVVEQPDTQAPMWPSEEIVLESLSVSEASLSWIRAQDLDEVRRYRVTLNGQERALVADDPSSEGIFYTLSGLSSNTHYELSIVAEDWRSNLSQAISIEFDTPAELHIPSDEEIRVGLAMSCGVCHGGCPYCLNDWFSSSELFQEHLIQNPDLITPGNADSSELIALLRAESTGLWGQMPPTYYGDGASYRLRVERGEATLTIAEVSAWINEMTEASP